jgi:hypothetical protein
MPPFFSSFKQTVRTLSLIFLAGSIMYSVFLYIRNLDTNNIPELTNPNQLNSDFVRAKIAKIVIYPETLQRVISNKTILITHITTDKGISFIAPIAENKVKENNIEAGSVLIFGKESDSESNIKSKQGEIMKVISKYPNMPSDGLMYLQGEKPDGFRAFQYAFYGLVAVIMAYSLTEKRNAKPKTPLKDEGPTYTLVEKNKKPQTSSLEDSKTSSQTITQSITKQSPEENKGQITKDL